MVSYWEQRDRQATQLDWPPISRMLTESYRALHERLPSVSPD